jgi:hypothetical protein
VFVGGGVIDARAGQQSSRGEAVEGVAS